MTDQAPVENAGTSAAPAPVASEKQRVHAILAAETSASTGRDEQGRFVPQAPRADSGTEPPPAEAVAEPAVEGADSEPAAVAEEPAEEVSISSLSDLAQHLGVEPADLYKITIPVTDADGNKIELPLGEWKDAVQTREKLSKREAELQKAREAWETRQREADQALAKRVAEFDAVITTAENRLNAEMQGIDWQQLRLTDPAEWTAKQLEYQQRVSELQRAKAEIVTRLEAETQKRETEKQSAYQQMLEREQQQLVAKLPDWRDAAKANAEKQKLREFMLERGFTTAEVDAVSDHRTILMLMDAMRYQEQAKAASAARKKVVKIASKVLTPGSRVAAATRAAEQMTALRQRAMASGGRPADLAALIGAKRKK